MKKSLISFIAGITLVMPYSLMNAQTTDAWQGGVELNPVFSTVEGVDPSFNLNFSVTRRVSEYLSIGAGLGVVESFDFSTNPTIPIFARFNVENFQKKLSPFLTFDVGYGLNTDNFDYGGLIINPTVGVRFGHFSLGVGYYGVKSFYEGSKFSSSINVRLAYNFGFHRSNSPLANALRKLEFSIDMGARFPLGGGIDFHDEKSWGNRDQFVKTADIKAGYRVCPDINLALLYPVTDNFHAGLMTGLNIAAGYDERIEKYFEYGNLVSEDYYGGIDYRDSESGDNVYPYSNIMASVQIGARLKYKFKELTFAKRFYPYAQLDLGYDINWDYDGGGSFFYAPQIGLSMDVNNGNHSLNLGISCIPQKLGALEVHGIDFSDSNLEAYGDYKETIMSLRVSLGYTF